MRVITPPELPLKRLHHSNLALQALGLQPQQRQHALPPPTQAQKDVADQKLLDYQKMRAEKGSESAQLELGLRYLNGKGVEADPAKAREWFEKSAKGGNTQAKKQLELMNKAPGKDSITNLLKSAKPVAPATVPSKTVSETNPPKTPVPNAPKK